MPQRYEFDAIDGTFVEFSDSWTRGEMLRFADMQGQEYFAFLASKMVAVCLPLGDGATLDDPAQFVARLDDVDMRAFYWLMTLPALEYGRIGRLGESTGRQWLKSYVQTLEQTALTAPSSN